MLHYWLITFKIIDAFITGFIIRAASIQYIYYTLHFELNILYFEWNSNSRACSQIRFGIDRWGWQQHILW